LEAALTTYKFVDEEPKSYRFVDEPKNGSPLPANAGLANLVSSVAGLPMDTVQNALNLTRAAQGTVATALGRHDYAPPLIENIPGGSQNIRSMLRGTGEPGLSPDNPSPQSKMGTAQYDFVSRGGVVPGGALPAAGSMVAEKLGGPEWAGVGALTPQATITGFNAARAPGLARQESQNAIRDATLRAGHDEGLVVPPSAAGGGFATSALESFGGKAAMGQEAALRNQGRVTDIARRELELPKNSAVSVDAIERQRNVWAEPYRQVAAIDPEAKAALLDLRQARKDATTYWRHFDRSADPQSQTKASEFSAKVDTLEQYLEGIAANAGKPSLVDELRKARTKIAKSHDIERALNLGTGDVSAPTIGRALDAGRPLTGGLETIGRFQQAFPHFMREGEKVPAPQVSALNPITSALLGAGGYGALGPAGITLGAIPLLRGPTRSGLLSGPVQNSMMPDYAPAVNPAPSAQLLYQLGILPKPE
jgi:hypothetical protein